MAVNYSKQFNVRAKKERTPQQEPIPGSTQVPNSAGGFSWKVTPWQKLERFLILGAEGGTYYTKEPDLVKESHEAVVACIKEDGVKAVQFIQEISFSGRAYKNDPAIFALALVTIHGDAEAKAAAYQAVPRVCRIGTHLFHFAEYVNAMRGWGRGLRSAIARWYAKEPAQLALQAVKYQQRDGWSHGDLLRLAHPKAVAVEQEAVFRWMLKGMDGFDEDEQRTVKRRVNGKVIEKIYKGPLKPYLPEVIEAFEEAKKADEKRLIHLITEVGLPREAVPTDKLNSGKVWDALLRAGTGMPLTAMIRNLGKMTSVGLISTFSDAERLIVQRLGDQEALRKARVHPMQCLIALKTYESGRGLKGNLVWSPNSRICTALDEAFYKCFKNVVPVGKPMLFAMDVSSSMLGSQILGTGLTAAEAQAALVLVHLSVEPQNIEVKGFSHQLVDIPLRKGMSLQDAISIVHRNAYGATDCSLPFEWLISSQVKVGGVVVTTDAETGSYCCAGQRHPAQALRAYRAQLAHDCRSVVVGMTSNSFTIADPEDSGMLDVVGFDANAPAVIADFLRGQPVNSPVDAEGSDAE